MVLHAWVDLTTLGFGDAAADAESPSPSRRPPVRRFHLALIGVVLVLRSGSSADLEAPGEHAAP